MNGIIRKPSDPEAIVEQVSVATSLDLAVPQKWLGVRDRFPSPTLESLDSGLMPMFCLLFFYLSILFLYTPPAGLLFGSCLE